jgi:hypothetical protein
LDLEKCDFSMRMLFRLLSVLLVFYASAHGAVELTVAEITNELYHLNGGHGAVTPGRFFRFKDFIEGTNFPADDGEQIASINYLRGLLNSNIFAANVRRFFQNTEFLSNRLLKLEIEHGNAGNNLNINPRTLHITNMMIRIETPKGSASGILIPVPDRFNAGGVPHHSWGILTCGHILDDVLVEKKVGGGVPENFTAHFNVPIPVAGNPGLNEILVHSIKVFKTNPFRLENKNGFLYEGFDDNIFNAQDIRAIPRYEYPGDLALCYLELTMEQIQAINQTLLAVPGGVYPNIQYNAATHQISFQGQGGFTYNFKFVNDIVTRDDLVVAVNGINNENNFVFGYALNEEINDYVLTLSRGRRGITQIYGGSFIDIAAHPGNDRMFFHDAPTYSGMSGGPVFNTPDGNNEINIFGVVHGYDSPEPPDDIPANNHLQSRCSASFLMEKTLN